MIIAILSVVLPMIQRFWAPRPRRYGLAPQRFCVIEVCLDYDHGGVGVF